MNAPLSFLDPREMEHWRGIRGWLLPEAAESLHKFAKLAPAEGTVVEIGSFAGKSTVCIARGLELPARQMTCIDLRFQPDFRVNIGYYGFDKAIRTLQGPSLDHFADWNAPISFLYIDGHHGKGYALADLLLWDMFVLPGGYVALDDTAGFMIGPNLQVQAMTAGGAYEFLEESGGISFLRKNHALSSISYHPLSTAVWFATLHYVSARLGAMDPWFRQPRLPVQKAPFSEWIDRFWHTSPAESFDSIRRKIRQKLGIRTPSGHGTPRPSSETKWLHENACALPAREETLAYLDACEDFRAGRREPALKNFLSLAALDATVELTHFRLPVRDLSLLRAAQLQDVMADRKAATDGFARLAEQTACPKLHDLAKRCVGTAFAIPQSKPTTLLREFNLELHEYKRQQA
jgi:hypothetical protein